MATEERSRTTAIRRPISLKKITIAISKLPICPDVQAKAVENYAALNHQYRKGDIKTGVIGYCIFSAYNTICAPNVISVERVAEMLECNPSLIYSAMSICSCSRTGISSVVLTPDDSLREIVYSVESSYGTQMNPEMSADLREKFLIFMSDQRTKKYTLRTLTIAYVYRYLSFFYKMDLTDYCSRIKLTPTTISSYLKIIAELGY